VVPNLLWVWSLNFNDPKKKILIADTAFILY